MSKNKKNDEIQNSIGADLLRLASEEGHEVIGDESLEGVANLTVPEFEDKLDQNSWKRLAKASVNTTVNPFLNDTSGKEFRDGGIFARSENILENGRSGVPGENLDRIDKNTKLPRVSALSEKNLEQERVAISSVETVAVTSLKKVDAGNPIKSMPQIPQSNVEQLDSNFQLHKKIKSSRLLQNGMPALPVEKQAFLSQKNLVENENKLSPVEQIRFAQSRISLLEKEVETLVWDNEKLGTATQLLQKKCEDLNYQKHKLESRLENIDLKYVEENKVLVVKLEQKVEELKELKEKFDILDSRLAQDVRRSGGRERELENRIELIKMEKISLVAGKDEIILNLKRQIDQFQFEFEGYRKKNIELQKMIEVGDEQTRRTVRALRLALVSLEVSEDQKLNKKNE